MLSVQPQDGLDDSREARTWGLPNSSIAHFSSLEEEIRKLKEVKQEQEKMEQSYVTKVKELQKALVEFQDEVMAEQRRRVLLEMQMQAQIEAVQKVFL